MAAPKIFVGIASARDWKLGFSTSMVHLTAHLCGLVYAKKLDNFAVRCQPASLLSISRDMLLQAAIDEGFTHILWIDDDTKFSSEAFDSMLSRDVDYVAMNFCKRTLPLTFCAHELGTLSPIDSGKRTGLEEVYQVGLGMALIKLDCLRDIPKPRFEVKWNELAGQYIGEDLYFCHLLKSKGVKLYVDHYASVLASHIGDYEYTFVQQVKVEEKEAA